MSDRLTAPFVSHSAQREVAVKESRFVSRSSSRRTLAVVLCLALPASAQDGGVLDAPHVIRLSNGSLLVNPTASKMLDDELKRLQGVERQHKGESWLTVVAISAGVGLVLGVVAGVLTAKYLPSPASPAAPPSP